MKVTSKEDLLKEFRLLLLDEEPDESYFPKFKQVIEVLNDDELQSFMSDRDLEGMICQEVVEEVLEIICILCKKGYLKSLKFLHEQFHDIGGPSLTRSALEAYAGKDICTKFREVYGWRNDYIGEQWHDPIPLSTAIYYGQTHTVEYLLSIGTLVDESNSPEGCLPLHVSCERGCLAITKLLVEHGADWKQLDYQGFDCFYIACCQGFARIVEYLIDLGAEVTSLPERYAPMSETPLGGACYYSGKLTSISDKDYYRVFLTHHYQVNCSKVLGEKLDNPCTEREKSDYPATIRLLLRCGNTEELLCRFDKRVFTLAAEGGSAEVLDLLLQYGKPEDVNALSLTNRDKKVSPLASACLTGNLEAVKFLISHGAMVNVDKYSNEDNEPIVMAAYCMEEKKSDILKLLLQHGADVNYYCGLPLQVAIKCSNAEAVEILLAAGAQLDRNRVRGVEMIHNVCSVFEHRYFDDYTPYRGELSLDEVKDRMKILRILLEAGFRSENALYTLCDEEYPKFFRMPPEMLRLLIYYGADVHKEVKGETALIPACHNLDREKIRILVEGGADVNKADKYGSTPLQICTKAFRKHCFDYFTDDIVRFLCEKGADIHIVRDSHYRHEGGLNLLELACFYYDETKLAIVLYYLSQGLALQSYQLSEELFQWSGLRMGWRSKRGSYSKTDEYKELISILVLDNAYTKCNLPSGPAGRFLLNLLHDSVNLPYLKYKYMQPDFEVVGMFHGAGFVLSVPEDLEQEIEESDDEAAQNTLKILQDELLRIPSLAELCRWNVRRILGPGLISQQKVEKLPLPKPIIEYILLLEVVKKKHAQTMYDYYTRRDSLKMLCPFTGRKQQDRGFLPFYLQPYISHIGKCLDCSTGETIRLQRRKEREETRKWAAEFLEQSQEEDRVRQEKLLTPP